MQRFTTELAIPAGAIDELGHVNNQIYIGWMQDIAVAHSSAQGWPPERYLSNGRVWVVRSHFVEYLRPLSAGDRIVISTWLEDLKTSSSLRKYAFAYAETREIAARAETRWVFIDLESGRPQRIPADLKDAFVAYLDRPESAAL